MSPASAPSHRPPAPPCIRVTSPSFRDHFPSGVNPQLLRPARTKTKQPPSHNGGCSHRAMGAQRNVFFKNARPFTAMSFRRGSILRQMAAARAMTFTSVVNDSITTSP